MNIQQIQYVLALAEVRHFERAADKCFVTQSTLSTMISRFEDELGIQIFDRKRKPLQLTIEGGLLIEQLKKIQRELDQLKEIAHEIKGEVRGNLTISVIPTVAPFILPLFLQEFAGKFPELKIEIKEQTTSEIINNLKNRTLDIGIISIPMQEDDIVEIKLYDEPFLYFDMSKNTSKTIKSKNINTNNLCLLEEGHCMRVQVMHLCDLHKNNITRLLNFDYKAGSIDSLLRFVKFNNAATLLPFLSTLDISPEERVHLNKIVNPVPYRSIGIVVHRHFVKYKILDKLKEDILSKVLPYLPKQSESGKELSPINFD